jgi:hypothetical protein
MALPFSFRICYCRELLFISGVCFTTLFAIAIPYIKTRLYPATLANYSIISPCLIVNGRYPDYPVPTIPLPISPPHFLINKALFKSIFLIST